LFNREDIDILSVSGTPVAGFERSLRRGMMKSTRAAACTVFFVRLVAMTAGGPRCFNVCVEGFAVRPPS
jgi:hypothetical protein